MSKHEDLSTALQLKNVTAVVTGSSTGIGRAIAIAMSRAGAMVIAHGRTESRELSGTLDAIRSHGPAIALSCDLADPEQFEGFVDRCWAWRSRVDLWVNNAGVDVLTGDLAKAAFLEKLEALYRVDVRATLELSRLVGSRMQCAGGEPGMQAILNIGWDQAWQGMAGESGLLFGTTKGAVMAMTKSLAQTFAPQVRVNCIAPGWIKTEWGDGASEYWRRRACRESLQNRWGMPEDIAEAAVMLCGPAGRFISGQIININGGFRFASTGSDE